MAWIVAKFEQFIAVEMMINHQIFAFPSNAISNYLTGAVSDSEHDGNQIPSAIGSANLICIGASIASKRRYETTAFRLL